MTRNAIGTDIPIEITKGGTGATTAPGALTNLGAVPLAGGTMTGLLVLSGDPVTALGAVTKQYADAIAGGFVVKTAVVVSTTANLTAVYANGAAGVGATLTNSGTQVAFAADGVSLSLNDRVLVPFQSSTFQNGIYTVTTVGSGATNWVLTRATDYDTAAEIKAGTLVPVTSGTLYADTSWIETATVTTVGTDPITFSQFTASPNTFARTSLNNLAAVAINTTLKSDTDLADDLGTPLLRWDNLYVANIDTGHIAGNNYSIGAWDTSGGGSFTEFLLLTAGNPPTCSIASGVTATTQSPGDNTTKIATTAFVTAAVVASGGANVHLSNLAAVAVNTPLLSTLDSTIDFGSIANRWLSVFGLHYRTGVSPGHAYTFDAYDTNALSNTTFATLTAGNPPTMALSGSVTTVTQSAADNSTKIASTAYADRMVPLAGGTMSGLLILSGDPVAALGAVTKQYADAIAAGVDFKQACFAATTANLNATYLNGVAGIGATLVNAGALAAFTVDGQSPAINSRILVKNQTSTFQNGIYTLSTVGSGAIAWVLTRSTDYDQAPSEIFPGTLVPVDNGTVNALSSWVETATVTTIGTDPITFSQFTASPSNFANTALSNLAAVAINTSLLPASDNAIDLGDGTHRWRELFAARVAPGTTSGNTLILSARNVGGSSDTPFFTLTSDTTTPTAVLASGVTGTTQSASDNTTKLATTAYTDNQATIAASGKANKALDNLASVAINTDLLGSADNSRSLGNGTVRFKDTYTATIRTGTTATNTVLLQAYDGSAYQTFITLTAVATTPTCVIASSVTGTTQSPGDNTTKLATTAFVTAAVSAGGANAALSNLAAVAINTALLPGADNTIDLGDGTHRFRELFAARVAPGTTSGNTLIFSGRNVGGASDTTFFTITSDTTTPTAVLASSVTATTQTIADNSTKLATTAYIDLYWPLSLARGGTAANLTASNGGIFYSTSAAGAILAGTATANQLLLSGASGAPAWSTVTHPATTTINQILYSSAANVISGLATANSSVLVTSAGGVPSLSTALPSAVQVGTGSLNSGTSASSSTYWRGDGTWASIAGASGGLVFIATVTASSSATVDFSNNLSSTYDNYLIVYENSVPATNNVQLRVRVGTGATPTYQATNYAGTAAPVGANSASWQASGTTAVDLMSSSITQSNTSTLGASGDILITNSNNASNNKGITSLGQYPVVSTINVAVAGAQWQSATVITSIRLLYSSGNVSTGTFKLYGIQN